MRPGGVFPSCAKAIAEHQQRFYGLEFDPDSEVLVTTGATEAIAASLLALVDPGDEVVVLEPYYDSYVACIAMAGGQRVPITLRAPDFRLDLERLRSGSDPRTRLMLINSPHNPTGTVLNDEELSAIAELAVERDLIVVTDEVYEHITFDGVRHRPLATYEGMRDRTLTISSSGKTFSLTGWKIGWAVGPATLVRATMMAKQFLTYTSGGAPAAGDCGSAGARRRLLPRLRGRPAGQARPAGRWTRAGWASRSSSPKGTYFLTTDIRPLGYDDGVDFCMGLPSGQGSSRSRTRSSTTTRRQENPWCVGLSANKTTSSMPLLSGWLRFGVDRLPLPQGSVPVLRGLAEPDQGDARAALQKAAVMVDRRRTPSPG